MIGAWVTLTGIEIEFCDWLGLNKHSDSRESGFVHTNNRNVSLAAAVADDQLGARCECAGKTYLWMTRWHNELIRDPVAIAARPDLEHPRALIDVKGVPLHRLNLICPPGKVKLDWLYLLVSAQEHPRYWIRGWCRGETLEAAPLKTLVKGRPCHVIAPEALRAPEELRRILLG
jgi:hypothetical protein